ncbi:tumor necrosis factor ligand superfamily member 12 isoform X2 [Paramormyrops kingsleyae]|uniref:tumor necrosis factor ligand superfamily member 12 isoform X2 n=1 Tax=Paramormyrops kingsleyae TaxID=1676925 RepID=UPI003B96FF2E
MNMRRIMQDRRQMRQLRSVWTCAAVLALMLAVGSVAFTAWAWGQTRSLSLSFKSLQYHLEQVNAQREAIVNLLLEKQLKMDYQRVKRDALNKLGRTDSGSGRRKKKNQDLASHFEIKDQAIVEVGTEGVIKGWTEERLNSTKAVSYDPQEGTFRVERRGVYFLYCQSGSQALKTLERRAVEKLRKPPAGRGLKLLQLVHRELQL